MRFGKKLFGEKKITVQREIIPTSELTVRENEREVAQVKLIVPPTALRPRARTLHESESRKQGNVLFV